MTKINASSLRRHARATLCALLIASQTLLLVPTSATAAIVSTEDAARDAQAPHAVMNSREKLHDLLQREQVRRALTAHGATPSDVEARVAALSDEEVARLADRVEGAPAGGDVLGIAFTVFIVLLVTDILGLTKVFPFTRSIR